MKSTFVCETFPKFRDFFLSEKSTSKRHWLRLSWAVFFRGPWLGLGIGDRPRGLLPRKWDKGKGKDRMTTKTSNLIQRTQRQRTNTNTNTNTKTEGKRKTHNRGRPTTLVLKSIRPFLTVWTLNFDMFGVIFLKKIPAGLTPTPPPGSISEIPNYVFFGCSHHTALVHRWEWGRRVESWGRRDECVGMSA